MRSAAVLCALVCICSIARADDDKHLLKAIEQANDRAAHALENFNAAAALNGVSALAANERKAECRYQTTVPNSLFGPERVYACRVTTSLNNGFVKVQDYQITVH